MNFNFNTDTRNRVFDGTCVFDFDSNLVPDGRLGLGEFHGRVHQLRVVRPNALQVDLSHAHVVRMRMWSQLSR